MKHRKKLYGLAVGAVLMIIGMVLPVSANDAQRGGSQEETVYIPDPQLKKLINYTLDENRTENADITVGEMKTLTYIVINSSYTTGIDGIENLEGLQYAENLTRLYINGDFHDITPVGTLKKLKWLDITNNSALTDLTQLGSMPNLTYLFMQECPSLTTLDGINGENFPALQELRCYMITGVNDISALDSPKLPALEFLNLTNSDLEDITPLKGYASLRKLALSGNRITALPEPLYDGFKDTIRSLTGLTYLRLPGWGLTGDDMDMLAPLTELKTLDLMSNQELTDTEFFDLLPEDLEELGLRSTGISNMDHVGRFKNLRVLEFSDDVTDFSFISELPLLTAGAILFSEDTFSTKYECGTYSDPVETQGYQIVIENPYRDPDGNPISFADADLVAGAEGCTFEYDAETNQITVSNLNDQRAMIRKNYALPLETGEYKNGTLGIEIYPEERSYYTISYDWGNDAPEGQILPEDTSRYTSLEEAEAAVDQTFTDQTVIEGEKDGTEGIWKFTGWSTSVSGKTVIARGSWEFEGRHRHSYGTDWQTDEKEHWHECTACGARKDAAAHTFEWTDDGSQNGSRYQQCSICGYRLPSSEKDKAAVPLTGDSENYWSWVFFAAVSAAGVSGMRALARQRKTR